jgi:hypothetical protein
MLDIDRKGRGGETDSVFINVFAALANLIDIRDHFGRQIDAACVVLSLSVALESGVIPTWTS